MQKIYIVLTFTGTILSRIIKKWTNDEFCHVSIALDEDLEQMYSFGRINPYIPFLGGFVHEGINKGTFKRFKNTKALIYALDTTQGQYITIKNEIKRINENKDQYSFNILGLFAVGFNKKIRAKHSFYCAEFVKYILEIANMNIKLPELVKPEDFKNIEGYTIIYKGKLKKYNKAKRKEYIMKYLEMCTKQKKEAI